MTALRLHWFRRYLRATMVVARVHRWLVDAITGAMGYHDEFVVAFSTRWGEYMTMLPPECRAILDEVKREEEMRLYLAMADHEIAREGSPAENGPN